MQRIARQNDIPQLQRNTVCSNRYRHGETRIREWTLTTSLKQDTIPDHLPRKQEPFATHSETTLFLVYLSTATSNAQPFKVRKEENITYIYEHVKFATCSSQEATWNLKVRVFQDTAKWTPQRERETCNAKLQTGFVNKEQHANHLPAIYGNIADATAFARC